MLVNVFFNVSSQPQFTRLWAHLILLALTDDHDAVHGDAVEHLAHLVHCRLPNGIAAQHFEHLRDPN